MKKVYTKQERKNKHTHDGSAIEHNNEISLKNTTSQVGDAVVTSSPAYVNQNIYDPLIDIIDAGIFVLNTTGEFIAANNAFCTIFGFKKEDLIGKNITILTANKHTAQLINSGVEVTNFSLHNWQGLHKDGHILNIETSTRLYLQKEGNNYSITTVKSIEKDSIGQQNTAGVNNINFVNTVADLIKNNNNLVEEDMLNLVKKFEELNNLNKVNEVLKLAEKVTHIGIVEVDYLNSECKWSDGCFKLFGLLPNEITASINGYEQFIHPEDKKHFSHSYNNSLTNKLPFSKYEIRILRKDNVELTISVNDYFTFNDQGKLLKLLSILQDITEQKKANNKVAESQKLLSSAEEIAGFGSAEYNIKTKTSILSDGFYRILGVKPGEIPLSPKSFLEFIHPDDKDLYLNWAKIKDIDSSCPPSAEVRIILQNNEIRNVLTFGTTIYNDNGVAEKIIGTIQDITDRKKIDLALKDSNEKFKCLFYDNPSAVFTLDLQGNITSANHIFILKAECTEEAIINMNYNELVHPADKARTEISFERAKKGDSQQIEIKVYTAKGNLIDAIIYSLPIIVEQKITGLFCISVDVTESKNAQLALGKELSDRKNILNYSIEFVCELDKEGNFIQASKTSIEFLGYTDRELIAKNFKDIEADKETVSPIHFFADISLGEEEENTTTNNYRTKNGEIVNLEWNMRWDRNNQIIYCIVYQTKNKNSNHQVLDLSQQHNRYLFNSNPQSLFLIDFLNLKITDANQSALSKYHYAINEFTSLSLNDFVTDNNITLLNQLQTEKDYYAHFTENNWMHIKKNGERVHLKMTGNIVNYKGRRCILTLIDDITETVNAAQAIKESEEIRRLIMNSALDAIICTDRNEKITFWNPQAEKIFGWNETEVLGKILPNIILPERYRSIHNEVVQSYLTTGECPLFNVLLHVRAKKVTNVEFPIELTITPIKEHPDEFFCLYIRDITEQQKAETQKEFERRDKEALINSTENFIWSVNKEYKLIAGNKPFIEAYKFFTGRSIKSGDIINEENIFFVEIGVSWKDLYCKALTGVSFKKEIKIPNSSTDSVKYYEINFNPIYKNTEITGVACYGNDITENKLNHNDLIIINTKLKTAQQIASLGYWEVNLKNNRIFLSDEVYKIFGIENTVPIMSIEKMFELIHPDDRKTTLKNYFLTVEGKQPFNHEHRIILKDGTTKVVVQKGTIVYNDKGQPITLEGTAQDITYRKNAEKLVKDSEEKYRMIFNSNPSANWIYDLESLEILEVNNAAIAHYGYSMAEFLTMSINDIFVQNEIAAIIEINKEISSYGIMKFGQWHHLKKSGEIINVDITGHAIFYNGKNAVMIVSNDITKILHTQLELAKSIERFEYATKATSDAIWDCDLVNNTMFWGEGFNILFGYKLKEREPGISSLGEFCHPEEKEKILKSIQKVINNKNEIHWQEEYRFKKYDGTYVTVTDRALVVRDLNGDPYRIIGAMQDVTERINNEKILKQLNSSLNKRAIDLARSNDELEQFAYITSHDLQEPLRMVSSFLTQIQKKYDPQLDETGRLYIRFAVDGAVRMRKIILDLLEYSRVGRQLYQYEKIDTETLLNEVVNMYRPLIEENKLVISFKNMPVISAARMPMQQLFQNLITNAIKYQQHDSVPIINIKSKEKDDHWLFSVKDNGIGIDEEYYKKIFIIFQRLHNKDEYSGTGIGLAICKKIIENHNGNIWVESTFGKGSTFYFTIPKLLGVQ